MRWNLSSWCVSQRHSHFSIYLYGSFRFWIVAWVTSTMINLCGSYSRLTHDWRFIWAESHRKWDRISLSFDRQMIFLCKCFGGFFRVKVQTDERRWFEWKRNNDWFAFLWSSDHVKFSWLIINWLFYEGSIHGQNYIHRWNLC